MAASSSHNLPVPFSIDPNIAKAWTPPADWYTSACAFEESKDKVFARSWQFVTDTDGLKAPGTVWPFTLLEGCLDEPLMIARDMDDGLHCLSNVCTHRGNIVCEGPTVERHLRCRYHGRRFNLDGKFHSMPEFEACQGFPSEKDNLPEIPFALWDKFLFVNLRPASESRIANPKPVPSAAEGSKIQDPPTFDLHPSTHPHFQTLQEWLSPMSSRLSWLPLNEFKHEPSRGREYLVRGHWALYVDNYLEGFHIPYIHAALNATLDYGSYEVELFDSGTLQLGVAKDGEPAFDLPSSSPEYGRRIGAYYYWIFPNLMFNFYPWGLSINVVRPLAPDLTKVTFIPYVWDAAKISQGAGGDLDRVEREDEAVVELVQRGLRSRFYDRGRYSPTREMGTHHFHRLLSAFLAIP